MTSPYVGVVKGTAPVSYWRLGESSGTVAADEMGANPGAYVSAPTLGVAGALIGDSNSAVTFNGTTQHVNAAQGTLAAPLSVSAWVNVPSLTGAMGVAGQYDGTLGYLLYLNPGASAAFFTHSGALIGGPILVVGQWTHLVGTHDGTNSRLYVNGVLAAGPLARTAPSPGATPFRIAAYSSGSGPLNGSIDEVAIWDRALSDAEIALMYSVGSSGVYVISGTAALVTRLPLIAATGIERISGSGALATMAAAIAGVGRQTFYGGTMTTSVSGPSMTLSEGIA